MITSSTGPRTPPQRRDEAPHLLLPDPGLPHGQRPPGVHRPPGQPGDHRHADRRVAHPRRRLPLLPRLRRRPHHHRGVQLRHRVVDDRRQPRPHGHLERRHRRERRRGSDVDAVQRANRVGAVAGPVRHRTRLHAHHVHQPRFHDQLPHGVGLRHGRQPQAPRVHPQPDRGRGEPGPGQVGCEHADHPPAVLQLPGPLRPARRLRRADRRERLPVQDAQFRIGPGLAGTGTVSIQSVNYPGYYLRHQNNDFVLAPDDGSALFRADASFHQVAGLASASWTSFRSYNHPDRHIRHYGYQLRLDPITDATGRADATFRLTA
ncbi:AbfB domain-containing protein [Actinokineospora soli]|uniref:AbfB domain-containing protein n=1 Tax=Actinokineospora soli TaxID=1048753 RepID=A0ABW2TNI9_9PSEU